MDRTTIQRQLARAEERVQSATMHIEGQRDIVERLKRKGLSTNQAKETLGALKQSLRRRQVDRNRLLAEFERVLRRELPVTHGSARLAVHKVRAKK
jgi:hypothetical protein